jgi:hypothetical protein
MDQPNKQPPGQQQTWAGAQPEYRLEKGKQDDVTS